jgi:hypothetical protein
MVVVVEDVLGLKMRYDREAGVMLIVIDREVGTHFG